MSLFDELKEGDEVGISSRLGSTRLVKVVRKTATMLRTSDERRFNKDGYQTGIYDSWSRPRLIPAAEAWPIVERAKHCSMLEHMQWRGLTLAQLRMVVALVDSDEFKNAKGAA